MAHKIDVNQLSVEILEQINKIYEDEFNHAFEEMRNAREAGQSGLATLHFKQIEAVRRHCERFTIELVSRVIEEIKD
ncbi:hypothetical protein JOD45_000285 [Scopulibacillus daqui]|uniref:Uncharacterized protein n=1 Tax=Scopulibacillus daqui TaxID=1469162 RepID=A0ABS2PVL1_9BACL|nr:hypothetical protein [Scopulibacillus daqui]MBM7644094.1 hypothetical protein [Scopulibacillus daqui]